MSKRKVTTNEMVAKSKKKVLACSTPEHRLESPSRDSDSICDSDAGSPVPFLCTQDGAEGETDVVWNFYTPKSDKGTSRSKNTTPLSRKSRKTRKLIEKPLPKRRTVRPTQKKIEMFQDLIELNQNLHEIIGKTSKTNIGKPPSCSEEDIFSDTSESSPKSLKTNSRCLRKNVLSSKFKKPEPEHCLESDDSMNECLLKVSQAVEENIVNYGHSAPKRACLEILNNPGKINKKSYKPNLSVSNEQDSMDKILSNIKLDSPYLNKAKKCDSPRFNNDSFDNLLGGLNDSALERLSQMPVKDTKKTSVKDSNWALQDVLDESQSFKSMFGRHNSMPESPSLRELSQPSTSGMALGRYSSMPFNRSDEKIVPGDSPIRCTPDEIKKKHQQAREKLLAKRLLPFTASPQCSQLVNSVTTETIETKPTKKSIFQPRIASATTKLSNQKNIHNMIDKKPEVDVKEDNANLKLLIEKKRQEALMKLRRRQPK